MPKSKKRQEKKRRGYSIADIDPVSNLNTIPPVVSDDFMSMHGYVIPKEKDLPKLHRAAWKGDLVKVQQITKNFKKDEVNAVDKEKRTALHLAAAQGHNDIVQHLCGLDANVKLCDKDGCTPVHKALESGHCSGLEYLLNGGGNANTPDKRGRRPLHLAAYLGNVAAATLLLERDAVLEELDGESNTALHIATLRGNCELVTSLLQDGAHVNAIDGKGRTPLMLAAREGRATLVKLLANHEETDLDLTDEDNCKAIDYAITKNHVECARMIEECEKVKVSEQLRLSQKPRQPSLVDEALIAEVFGLKKKPSPERKDDAPSKSEAAPTQTEDPPTEDSVSEKDWAPSDTEDENWGSKPSTKVNLKAGLKRAMSASKTEPEVAPQPSPAPTSNTLGSHSSKKEALTPQAPPTKPTKPQHYQLTTESATESSPAPAREPKEKKDEGLVSESEEHSIGSGFDSDDASLPLSSTPPPTKQPFAFGLKSDQVTKPGDHMTAMDEAAKAQPAKSRAAKEKSKGSELKETVPQKTAEAGTKPEPASKNQHGTEQGDETSNFDTDSDSSLGTDGDLPGFSAYTPSTPGDTPGRATLLNPRKTSDLSLKDIFPKTPVTAKKSLPAPADAVTSPSTITEVTPMSSGVFTPDAFGGSYPRGQLMLGSPMGNVLELPEESDGESNQLLAQAEKVEKTPSFSEKKEADKVLIAEVFGSKQPSQDRKDDARSKNEATPTQTEDPPTRADVPEKPSGTEDEDCSNKPSTEVNLKAGLKRAMSASKTEPEVAPQPSPAPTPNTLGSHSSKKEALPTQAPPTKPTQAPPTKPTKPQHYQLTTESATESNPAPAREPKQKKDEGLVSESENYSIGSGFDSDDASLPLSPTPPPTEPLVMLGLASDQVTKPEDHMTAEAAEAQPTKNGEAQVEENNGFQASFQEGAGDELRVPEGYCMWYPNPQLPFYYLIPNAASPVDSHSLTSDQVTKPEDHTTAEAAKAQLTKSGEAQVEESNGFEAFFQEGAGGELGVPEGYCMWYPNPQLPFYYLIPNVAPPVDHSLTSDQVTKPEDYMTAEAAEAQLTKSGEASGAGGELGAPEDYTMWYPNPQVPFYYISPIDTPPFDPPLPPPRLTHEQVEKTLEKTDTPCMKRSVIGNALYYDIYQLQPDLAKRISGMLLDMENDELLHMLKEPRVLRGKVDEAIKMIQDPNYVSTLFTPTPAVPAHMETGMQEISEGAAVAAKDSPPKRSQRSLGVPRTLSDEASLQLKKSLGMLEFRSGPQSLGVPRTPSDEASLQLKENLGMLNSPRSQPPHCETIWCEEYDVARIEALMLSSQDEQPNPKSTSNPGTLHVEDSKPTDAAADRQRSNPSVRSQKQRRKTTAVSKAAKEREEMDKEASRRLYERNNEFLLLMKSKHFSPPSFDGNPPAPPGFDERTGTTPPGGLLLSPISPPRHSVPPLTGMENLGMETTAGISRGSSRVQMMRQMWESGATIGRQGETSTVNPQKMGSESDLHAHNQTQQVALPEQGKKPEVDNQRDARAPSALPLLEPAPPTSGSNPEGNHASASASDDEILEVLSASEKEGESPPPREMKLPKTVVQARKGKGPSSSTAPKAKAVAEVTQQEGVSPRTKTTPPKRHVSRSKTPPPLGEGVTPMRTPPPLGGVAPKTSLPVLSSRDGSEATSPESSTFESHSDTPPFNASALCAPLPMALTPSQLDTSPLRLHHLEPLTPPPLPQGSGQKRNSQNPNGVLSDSHSLDHVGSQSDLTSHVETQSHDPLSESHDPPTESQDLFSEVGNLEDLPFGHVTRLSQSAGNSLLGSAQVSQLQESLREARRGLERNQDSLAACKRAKRQLETHLDDCQRKYDEAFAAKLKLENSKLDLELQVREIKYSLEQERESRCSSEAVAAQLREQLNKTEDRLSREIEARQGAELRRREGEIEQRALSITNQQLQEQVVELGSTLKSEREAKILQDGLYKEQIRMFQSLQEESRRAQEQKTDVLSQLQAADASKHGMEEKLAEFHRLNMQLQVDLTNERRQSENHITRMEAEIETLKERLQRNNEDKVAAENGLLAAQQQFEAGLSELRSKADLLSSTLDKEAGGRKVAQEEASSLRTRLEQVSRELQETTRKRAEGEQRMGHALEELRREKALLERDLATARESNHQLSGRLEGLSQRMTQGGTEARAQQAALLERTNQIAVLQRELDQWQVKLQAADTSVQREKELVSQLEAQLSLLRERLSGSEAECSKLRVEVERAGRRMDERESSSQQQQQQLTAIFDSLRADSEKMKVSLEARQQSLMEQLMSVKEESARKEAEGANTRRELSQLQEEHSSLRAAYSELQETLSATEEAFRELEGEKEEEEGRRRQLEERVAALQEELATSEQNNQALGEKMTALRTALAQAQEVNKTVETDKGGLLEQKMQLESVVASLRGQLVALEGELGTSRRGEEQLRAQTEHLNQIRSDLERTASQLQGEVMGLQGELGEARAAQEKATREAEEARGLWESEVKSRSKLGMKVLEMERSQTDSGTHVEAERKRTRKAMELRRMAEMKFESLQERNAQLQQEAAGLRTQLKLTKKQVRQMEANESQLPGLRAEFDREQLSLQTEMAALKRQLESTQDQLCRESELRVKADHATSRARQELEATTTRVSLNQSQTQAKQKELQKLERANRKLREELRALQDHMATSTVSKAEMETYRRMVEEKAQQELNCKLEEVNTHLAQQSQTHEALERLRASSESEWKQKLERSSEELCLKLAQALADRQTTVAEARRFKELYESELRKCQKLTGKLQKAKEEAIDSKTKLSLERNRTQHLLNTTQSSAIRVASPAGPHRHTHITSTPLRPSGTTADHSSTEELLGSVRMELDRSIARHLDSVPPKAAATMATRSTYRSSDSILLGPQSKNSHLDAIKRNYHV